MAMHDSASPPKLLCPVCQSTLEVRLAKGRRSEKSFLMLVCPKDGRHIRAFITDQGYVQAVLARLEASQKVGTGDQP